MSENEAHRADRYEKALREIVDQGEKCEGHFTDAGVLDCVNRRLGEVLAIAHSVLAEREKGETANAYKVLVDLAAGRDGAVY